MRIRQAPAENLLHTFPELSHIGVSDIDNISSIFNFMSLCILYTTVRGVYNHKLAHIDSRERSWCVMVCRDRSTDVRFCHPFRSLFADFRRFSPLKAHIDPLTTQISKCYTSSSFCPIKILINMIDSKFQRKQNILLRFSIFAIKKKI